MTYLTQMLLTNSERNYKRPSFMTRLLNAKDKRRFAAKKRRDTTKTNAPKRAQLRGFIYDVEKKRKIGKKREERERKKE